MLEEHHTASQLPHDARAQDHHGLRGAFGWAAAAPVVRAVGGAQHGHRQPVFAQYHFGELLQRTRVVLEGAERLGDRARERGEIGTGHHAGEARAHGVIIR